MATTEDQYKGCLLGLALGDALGAPYEGGILERILWRVVGRTKENLPRWTDDTQMALDLAESLLQCNILDQDDLARRFADSYRWSRGYGPSTARVLKRIRRGEHWSSATKRVYKSGSFGNGAAMRASILALFFIGSRDALINEARRSAEVTHAHLLGVDGAILISVATCNLLHHCSIQNILNEISTACGSPEFKRRLSIVSNWIDKQYSPSPKEVATKLGNGMTAESSCVTALYVAMRHLDANFNEMMAFAIACGGDVDTIGAMAGTLWGTYNGASALPNTRIEQQGEIERTAIRLHEHAMSVAKR